MSAPLEKLRGMAAIAGPIMGSFLVAAAVRDLDITELKDSELSEMRDIAIEQANLIYDQIVVDTLSEKKT